MDGNQQCITDMIPAAMLARAKELKFGNRFRYLCQIISLVWMAGMVVWLAVIWFLAFINGGQVIVTINDYSEMYPELIMWITFVPFMFYGFWLNLKEVFCA